MLWLEAAHALAAIGLGAGERDIGVPQQLAAVSPSLGAKAMPTQVVHTNSLSAT